MSALLAGADAMSEMVHGLEGIRMLEVARGLEGIQMSRMVRGLVGIQMSGMVRGLEDIWRAVASDLANLSLRHWTMGMVSFRGR